MKRSRYRKGAALILSCFLAVGTCLNGSFSPLGVVNAQERSGSVNATNLNVRSGPGTTYQSVGKLSQGAAVTVIGEQAAADGVLWYQIRFTGAGGAETVGYVSSQYIKFPIAVVNDGNFENYLNQQGFPESYKPGLRELHTLYPQWTFKAFQTNLDWNTVIQNESVIGRNLVSRDSVSSWKSTAVGAYDWNTGTWPGFDGNAWVQASEDIIRYYMDPRNFLNDRYVFQFLNQSYDGASQTREGLEKMVAGTFLAGAASSGGAASGVTAPGSGTGGSGSGTGGGSQTGPGGATGPGASGPGAGSENGGTAVSPVSPVASVISHPVDRVMTAYGPGMGSSAGPGSSGSGVSGGGAAPVSGSSSYIDIIMNAAAQSGVSPYILASMIIQEQGSQGTGRSISGTVPGYEGYYNFMNIEAYQSGSMGAVEHGLWWAAQAGSYERPWNSVEKSILGGAIFYGNNYVKKGQNTLYLKKFNVQGSNLYKHQYMTNVLAAAAEGLTLAKIDALKGAALEFSIPVYRNMPDTACVKPTLDGSPNNKLNGLGVEGFALTPTFNRDTESYDLIVDPSVASVTVAAAALDSSAVVSGTGTVNLVSGVNDILVTVTAGNGSVRNYVIHVVRQSNGPTYSSSIGSGVSSGAAGGSGGGPGGGSTQGPGAGGTGGSDSSVEIIGPPGTNSGGGTGAFIAPDGSSVNGFGAEEDPSGMRGPGGAAAPGLSGPAEGGSPQAGSGGEAGAQGGAPSSQNLVAAAGTSASQLSALLASSGIRGTVKVCTAAGGEVTGLVGTGNLVQVFGADGSPAAQYEMVVKGDNNGDGKLDILDILNVQRHILGLGSVTGKFEAASDVNGNGKIDIMDILAMQRDVLGIQKLDEGER